jgi:hypothetical protein
MKKSNPGLAVVALVLLLIIPLPALARAQKTPTLKQQLGMTARQFFGGVWISGDTDSFSGTFEADNPKCILTIPITFPGGYGQGNGPNGSIVLQGSDGCSGIFELFLGTSTGFQYVDPTTGNTLTETGVETGAFTIVKTPDTKPMRYQTLGTTVEWAGTYTEVDNIDGTYCGTLNFCANLGSNYGWETFNGSGLAYLLFLNGFTFNGPNQ